MHVCWGVQLGLGDASWTLVAYGNKSIVSHCRTDGTEATIARKALRYDDCLSEFEAEAAVLQSMRHQNVLRPIAHTTDEDGAPALLMEYFQNGTVRDWTQ